MGKILYLECNSGISGDMTVGALLDLGADRKVLEKALDSLGIGGYHLHFGRKETCGLDAYDFDVHLEEDAHEYSHSHGEHNHSHEGHEHSHVHECSHNHGGHEHSHSHDGNEHYHSHEHRNLYDVYEIIDRLDSSGRVKDLAKKMFAIVAEAESKAHGLPIEQVHFHEVGAIDSIIDIVSVAVCVDNLGIEDVAVSPLSEGCGHVRCQHGVLPVPVPATANIALAHGLTLRFTQNEGEMVTPTGAAIAAALKTRKGLPADFRLLKIGMGAGNKVFSQANVLRAMLLETGDEKTEPEEGGQTNRWVAENPPVTGGQTNGWVAENPPVTGRQASGAGMAECLSATSEQIWVMETNLDDCSGEVLGFAMETLLEAGAADVWYTPILMKKNRPAYKLSVLCRESIRELLEDILFSMTTTIGIRRYPVKRSVLNREQRQVETKYGLVDVKICYHKEEVFYYPEYESVHKICKEKKVDFQRVYCEAQKMAELEKERDAAGV